MSHVPRTFPSAIPPDSPTEVPFICISKHSTHALPIMQSSYVPLADRTADQLREHAEELRRMAATASTPDVRRALLSLADRYADLADKRRGPRPDEGPWPDSPPGMTT
jgi:hypothetical protein